MDAAAPVPRPQSFLSTSPETIVSPMQIAHPPVSPVRRMTRLIPVAAALLMSCVTALSASAAGGGGAGGGGAGGGVGDGFVGPPIAGIDIDAGGVLKMRRFDPRLAAARLRAARAAAADQDVMRPSELRKVSLRRMESAIESAMDANPGTDTDDLPADIRAMAGLTSIRYVFYYPETQDIVVAGPAEGFFADPTERMIGTQTGRPTVLLEDWITAMRAFDPAGPPTRVISVSIDPTPEGLQRMQQFLARVRPGLRPADSNRLAMGLKDNLGLQTVTFQGIPTTTHFARVLVEADYRMKLIGIGLERVPVPLKSYVDRANPSVVAANAMERWYFQPNYDGVSVSDDSFAMRIDERGVQLVGQSERVAGGQRTATGRRNRASAAFTQDFTRRYNDIADRVRVYAELKQLIDISIAAAYIREQNFYELADWNADTLMNESAVAVETYNTPQQVETAVNAIWRGNTLMTPLGGGIHIQPMSALSSDNLVVDSAGDNQAVRKSAAPPADDNRWWWD